MTKTLSLDEMLDCLELMADPDAKAIARQLEAVGDVMAGKIAAALNVERGDTHREESAFAGTCATFWPKEPGQPCPEPLAMYDASEWEAEDDAAPDEREARIAQCQRDGWTFDYQPNGWYAYKGNKAEPSALVGPSPSIHGAATLVGEG